MRLDSLLIICLLTGSLAACSLNSPMPRAQVVSRTPSPDSRTTPVTVGANQYLVQKGDTLYSIGRKFGIPFQKLAEINQLQTPYEIHVGQVLNLKQASGTTAKVNDQGNAVPSDDAEVVTAAISRPGLAPEETAPATSSENMPAAPTADGVKPANGSTDIETIADSDIQWQWPLSGKINEGFDPQMNKGLNIAGTPGQVVNAAGGGKVIYSGMDVRGYGKLVIIKHNSNLLSVYAHQGNSLVKEGAYVNAGDKLAVLPPASNNKPPVLHFEIRQKGKPVDPVSYLPNNSAITGSPNHS